MKQIRRLTPMLTLTFRSMMHLSDRKCVHFRLKDVDVYLEITEIYAALLLKIEGIVDCRNNNINK